MYQILVSLGRTLNLAVRVQVYLISGQVPAAYWYNKGNG